MNAFKYSGSSLKNAACSPALPSTRTTGLGTWDPRLKIAAERVDGLSMGSEMFAVEAVGLRKAYGEKIAVGCLDLAVPSGSFFGVVGPNGAGKTTTLRMMTGLLRPDAGRVGTRRRCAIVRMLVAE